MESPFDVLGVAEDADDDVVKRAYRERVKETHPDQGGSTAAFQRVRTAYEAIQAGEHDLQIPTVAEVDAEEEDAAIDDEEEEVVAFEGPTVEYLNYAVLEDHGWSLDDDDLFEKAAEENLDAADYGTFHGSFDEYLLDAAEEAGNTWPYSCRSTACANCAIALCEGEMAMPKNHILPDEMLDRGIRLSCVGTPTSEELKVVYNVKHLPELDELRLPPGPFKGAQASD
ncbi:MULTISPECIES: ferredoxin Fer [Salinibaculum]|uniref:ferredoxin Fer n=1 Tax=Salinibaculum TaxID=2732368 RepID=UPI0030CC16E6